MNGEQIAFFNHQLAGMLRAGIPLEAALRKLCQGLGRGHWSQEMERLQTDLAQGIPLSRALEQRRLPPVYVQLVRVGAATNDLPRTLTLVADHFAAYHMFWTRFRAVLLYPIMVLILTLAVCLVLACLQHIAHGLFAEELDMVQSAPGPGFIWFGPALILGALTVLVVVPLVPRLRFAASWRVPGWKEGMLAQLASSLSLLLRGGTPLPEALDLMAQVEPYPRARAEFNVWRSRLAQGQTQFAEFTQGTRLLPPLFIWLIAGAGEDLAAGFDRAAELYQARARHRLDLVLFALMPAAVLLLGGLVLGGFIPLTQSLSSLMEALGEPL